jgi:hypothetical protein
MPTRSIGSASKTDGGLHDEHSRAHPRRSDRGRIQG